MTGWVRKVAVPAILPLSFAFVTISSAQTPEAKAPYPAMAPVEQYMMERGAEVALALTAAPAAISGEASVMVMGRHGYETAVQGKNGFVCLIERSWTTESDDPGFWNPKLRAPICFNPAAARTVVPLTLKKTELVLAGKSRTQMVEAMKAALDKKELLPLEPGAMCYMMSKQGYLNDRDGHWHPHLMFFAPLTDPASWGANVAASPVYGAKMPEDRLTIFFVPLAKWSDGTDATMEAH